MPVFASLLRPAKRDLRAKLRALDMSQAIIEYVTDGTIITANDRFLETMGYALADIAGRHHGMFVDPAQRESPEYRQFWAALAGGRHQSGVYRRFGNDGREIWLQASYNPVLGRAGKAMKIVELASDITEQNRLSALHEGQISAISKSQAVIQFRLDGTIITANENFLRAAGHELSEIQGQHHSMLVDPAQRHSPGYIAFWEALNRGEYQTAEYRRLGKNNREIWILASYNPILDPDGKAVMVVKFATDITAQVKNRLRRATGGTAMDSDLAETSRALAA